MNRVALITGGARGLGAAAARALCKQGFAVAVTDIKPGPDAKKFSRQTDIPVYFWDVGDFDACAAGVAEVERDLGPIDTLFNNAGVCQDAMFHKMSCEQWRGVLHTDLDSMFNMTRQVINGMRERGFGRIINMSSVNAQRGQVGQTNYSAAKAGVIGFTKALARENATKGITVNAIAPGYCDTPMVAAVPEKARQQIIDSIPMKRLGDPSEIARCVIFLSSEEASYVTGTTVSANGALYMT